MSNTNLPPSGLNSLYNTPVQSAEWVTRPKQGMPNGLPNLYVNTHSGVRVTTAQGDFLIHKGPGYGKASDTVVTAAEHMSSKWKVKESRDFSGTTTVGDFVKTGGAQYSIPKWQHCHSAAKDMMNQGKK